MSANEGKFKHLLQIYGSFFKLLFFHSIFAMQGFISMYSNDLKFSERQVWANSVDPDQTAPSKQSDQGLHCLPFLLHLLDKFLYGNPLCLILRVIKANMLVSAD